MGVVAVVGEVETAVALFMDVQVIVFIAVSQSQQGKSLGFPPDGSGAHESLPQPDGQFSVYGSP